jgi:hypothetical protein
MGLPNKLFITLGTLAITTLLREECEDETHTLEMGTWESFGTPKSLEFDCKGQNTSHWGVLYIIGKLWKCRYPKWACMTHLDIWNTSYGQKKGRESNWQFNSRPLKVGNRPDFLACKWHATYHWKSLNKGYNFASNLISIKDLHTKLWDPKVTRVPTLAILGLPFGSPRTKCHLDVGLMERHIVYYKGKVVASRKSRPWWILQVWVCPWLVLTPKVL